MPTIDRWHETWHGFGVSPTDELARLFQRLIACYADAEIVVDVDLSILGAAPERFEEYERQIRAEYRWVPGFLFRRKRAKILQEFLARPRIFSTQTFIDRYEQQARANIARSLTRLRV
jgi:predicted metal-dependent HD superfamily phosphohydrolase